jgi:hypothetical protein
LKYPNLQSYPRPAKDNRIGIHWNGSAWVILEHFIREMPRLKRAGIRWIKIVAENDSGLAFVQAASNEGFEVIVRFWGGGKPHPHYIPSSETVAAYVRAGAHYFEPGNEPNLIDEWGTGRIDVPALMAQWTAARRSILAGGGIPMLYSLSPGGNYFHNDMYTEIFRWLRANGDYLEDCAIAAHPRPLNHPLAYPLDNSMQARKPGTRIEDDNISLTMVNDLDRRVRELTGGRSVPIIATEHGCSLGDHQDSNYARIDETLHRVRNVDEMLTAYRTGYIPNPGGPAVPLPDAFFAGCYWIWGMFGHYAFAGDSWTDNPFVSDGVLSSVDRLIELNETAPFPRFWHNGTPPVESEKPDYKPPTDPKLRLWNITPLRSSIIAGNGAGGYIVAKLDNHSIAASPKPEHGPQGFEIAGLGAGVWTLYADGFAPVNIEIRADRGAFLTPSPVSVIEPPPDEPPPPQKPAEPVYRFELGFADYARDNPDLGLAPVSGMHGWHPTGDVVQAVKTKTGRRGFLIWYHVSKRIHLTLE